MLSDLLNHLASSNAIMCSKAYKADTRGNLIFRGTSQNANPDAAVAGKVVLVR